MKRKVYIGMAGSAAVIALVVTIGATGALGKNDIINTNEQASYLEKANKSAVVKTNAVVSADKVQTSESASVKNEISGTEKYIKLIGQSKDKVILELNENPVSIDEGGLEFKKAGMRVWFKDYGNGSIASQIFTQNKDINFDGAKIGDKIGSFKKALGNPVIDENGEAHFKYNSIFLSINYDTQTGDTVCVYFLKEDYIINTNEQATNSEETNKGAVVETNTVVLDGKSQASESASVSKEALVKPQVEVAVDLEVEKGDQKNADKGSAPWKLDPVFVAQVFTSLKVSPDGIQGEYPVKQEELKLANSTETEAEVEVKSSKTNISKVYLKRLVKQDKTGIWTVVGYDQES